MKAVGLTRYLPIDQPESLMDIELPVPQASFYIFLGVKNVTSGSFSSNR